MLTSHARSRIGKPKFLLIHPSCSPSPSISCLVSWSLITRGFLNQLTPNLSLLGDGMKSQWSGLGQDWRLKGRSVVDCTWETTKLWACLKREFTPSMFAVSTKLESSFEGESCWVCGISTECNYSLIIPSVLVGLVPNSTEICVLLFPVSLLVFLSLGLVRGGFLSPTRSEWTLMNLPLLSLGLIKTITENNKTFNQNKSKYLCHKWVWRNLLWNAQVCLTVPSPPICNN